MNDKKVFYCELTDYPGAPHIWPIVTQGSFAFLCKYGELLSTTVFDVREVPETQFRFPKKIYKFKYTFPYEFPELVDFQDGGTHFDYEKYFETIKMWVSSECARLKLNTHCCLKHHQNTASDVVTNWLMYQGKLYTPKLIAKENRDRDLRACLGYMGDAMLKQQQQQKEN